MFVFNGFEIDLRVRELGLRVAAGSGGGAASEDWTKIVQWANGGLKKKIENTNRAKGLKNSGTEKIVAPVSFFSSLLFLRPPGGLGRQTIHRPG